MWKQSENIVHRLFSRQVSRGAPNTHIHRARQLYENVVPGHTVYDVDCPDQWWRRFTNDGQYLICFSRSYQDLVIYRPLWLSYCSTSENLDELPAKSKKFESYFSLLHQIPLATSPNEVICKDFFLSTENNQYGIFATSTAPDNNAPAAPGAVAGVPSIEKITFFVVRLADGVITGQSVFQDDYIHLAHNAGVFLHDDLLAILSIRFQRIHILQVRDGGLFLDVRTIGKFCREDDELLLNSQAQDEAKFQKEQSGQRKARGLVPESEAQVPGSQHSNNWSTKPWTNLSDNRRRPRPRDARATTTHDPISLRVAASRTHLQNPNEVYGVSHGDDINVLYDGYFRGLFPHANANTNTNTNTNTNANANANANGVELNIPNGNGNGSINSHTFVDHGSSYENAHVRRFAAGGGHSENLNNLLGRRSALGREHGNSEISSSGRHPRYGESASHEVMSGLRGYSNGGEYVAVRENTTAYGRRFDASVSTSGSLYSSSGSDTVSLSYNTATDVGSSDATMLHDFSSHNEDPGPSERWNSGPVPSLSVSARAIGTLLRHPGLVFREDNSSLPGPSVGLSRSSAEDSGGAGFSGRAGGHNTGPANSSPSQDTSDSGRIRGQSGTQSGSPAEGISRADDVPQGGSQILGGLKQRLLSFILQGIKDDNTSPATKAQQLKRFYYHFQHYVDLVMWKVQFLDRYHLLIKFGSVDGVVLRNSEASHQTAFLAIYNLETTQILGFYQNSSEELLQLVERHCDHFRVAPQYPLYMNFISSFANNSYTREQLRKQKAACVTSKGSYAQVVKRTLAALPYNSQSQSPSAYFDQYLFHYDEKLISSTDRHKPCMEHPIKFISRRRPNTLKFKINPGLELGSNDGHIKRIASFLFHPIFPFAISVQQSLMQTTIVNFHFRR